MSDTRAIGFPTAASRLGVSPRVLRQAIRAGRISHPPHLTAVAAVPDDWLTRVEAEVEASPKILRDLSRNKVPAFARYEGTSAWRKDRRRAREFARLRRGKPG